MKRLTTLLLTATLTLLSTDALATTKGKDNGPTNNVTNNPVAISDIHNKQKISNSATQTATQRTTATGGKANAQGGKASATGGKAEGGKALSTSKTGPVDASSQNVLTIEGDEHPDKLTIKNTPDLFNTTPGSGDDCVSHWTAQLGIPGLGFGGGVPVGSAECRLMKIYDKQMNGGMYRAAARTICQTKSMRQTYGYSRRAKAGNQNRLLCIHENTYNPLLLTHITVEVDEPAPTPPPAPVVKCDEHSHVENEDGYLVYNGKTYINRDKAYDENWTPGQASCRGDQ